jgi:hypothetical protein
MWSLLCLVAATFVPTLGIPVSVRNVVIRRRRFVAALIIADSRVPRRSWKNRWSQRLDWYVCAAMGSMALTCAL